VVGEGDDIILTMDYMRFEQVLTDTAIAMRSSDEYHNLLGDFLYGHEAIPDENLPTRMGYVFEKSHQAVTVWKAGEMTWSLNKPVPQIPLIAKQLVAFYDFVGTTESWSQLGEIIDPRSMSWLPEIRDQIVQSELQSLVYGFMVRHVFLANIASLGLFPNVITQINTSPEFCQIAIDLCSRLTVTDDFLDAVTGEQRILLEQNEALNIEDDTINDALKQDGFILACMRFAEFNKNRPQSGNPNQAVLTALVSKYSSKY
jgi:hypothetical protein